MTRTTIIRELAFEKNCTQKKALEIYNNYKAQGKLQELQDKIKSHKEV